MGVDADPPWSASCGMEPYTTERLQPAFSHTCFGVELHPQ